MEFSNVRVNFTTVQTKMGAQKDLLNYLSSTVVLFLFTIGFSYNRILVNILLCQYIYIKIFNPKANFTLGTFNQNPGDHTVT